MTGAIFWGAEENCLDRPESRETDAGLLEVFPRGDSKPVGLAEARIAEGLAAESAESLRSRRGTIDITDKKSRGVSGGAGFALIEIQK